jgi:hypothetical protein
MSKAQIKNRNQHHDFQAIGGYDPELDGDDSRWGRALVKCNRCGEERRIGVSIGEVNIGGGCVRKGSVEPWQPGDLLSRHGALDQYVKMLDIGLVLTWNAGGHYHEAPVCDLTPILGDH